MFDDEVRDLLTGLLASTGAVSVRIRYNSQGNRPPEQPDNSGWLSANLGAGAVLELRFEPDLTSAASLPDSSLERDAALERATRALRAAARRWEVTQFSNIELPGPISTHPQKVLDQLRAFLSGFVGSLGMDNAAVTHRGRIVQTASTLTELQRERIPFTIKRVAAQSAKGRGVTSHGEILGDDFFATAFWFDACLIAFASAPFSIDFVRHRARLLTRELTKLLEMLDDAPRDPAMASPKPE